MALSRFELQPLLMMVAIRASGLRKAAGRRRRSRVIHGLNDTSMGHKAAGSCAKGRSFDHRVCRKWQAQWRKTPTEDEREGGRDGFGERTETC